MANNSNGKIGVGGVFKDITNRKIGVAGVWKEQDFKYIGENGYWRLIYTKNPIDLGTDFYVRYLEGYTLNQENSLTIYGDNLKDYQLISPKIGGYYEIEKNGQDLFENFANGSFSGSPIFGTLGDKKCLQIVTSSDNFTLPSDLDARGIFGSDGLHDYTISTWFYVNALPTSTDVIPIVSFGDRINGMEIVVSSDARLQQKFWSSNTAKIIETPASNIELGWNSFVVTRTSNVTSIYLNGSSSPLVTDTKVMLVPLVSTLVKVGMSYKYSSTTTLPQAFSTTRTATRYELSNSNKTITKISGGNGTARSNNFVSPNTGKYYFEAYINSIVTGIIWVGLGDVSVPQTTAVGAAGWSIASDSKTNNKSGGVVWGSGTRTFTTGDVIGCIYDSDAGTATWYKNNTLWGTSTSAIVGDVVFMIAGDKTTSATIRIKSSDWTYSSPVAGAVEMPATVTYSGLTNYSVAGTGLKYVYASNQYQSSINIQKLLDRTNPTVIIKDKITNVETTIPDDWMLTIANEKIIITLPTTTPSAEYNLFIRYFTGEESYKFPINVVPVSAQTSTFIDDFSDLSTLTSNYYALEKAWGGANGGVVAGNVFIRDGELIIRGNGDNYTGNIQGVDRDGIPKIHTNTSDPQYGMPWKNRVGGCLVYNRRTGFGSYEIDALIPNNLGCAYAMWTFFYNEIHPTDPRYNNFLTVEGLHQQGSAEDGYYITRNHEIDIEFPSHLNGGTLSNPSLSNFKANTWRGELQNWDVPTTDPLYWEEYRDNLTPVGFSVADGNYHKLRYDWFPDRVEFYIDGVLKQTNVNTPAGDTIPDISGYFTFGIWFPSSPLASKPWLADPARCWGGGVVDSDGGMKADFDVVEMKVKQFKFTPFNEYASEQRDLGETYPFGGYNKNN